MKRRLRGFEIADDEVTCTRQIIGEVGPRLSVGNRQRREGGTLVDRSLF